MQGVYLKPRIQDHIKATLDFHAAGGKINELMVLELCDVMLTFGICLRNHSPAAQGTALKGCAREMLKRIKYPALRVLVKKMLVPFALPKGVFNELEHIMESCINGMNESTHQTIETNEEV